MLADNRQNRLFLYKILIQLLEYENQKTLFCSTREVVNKSITGSVE